ncbi:MAG: GTPase HflX [Peptococcaceae bacterium]
MDKVWGEISQLSNYTRARLKNLYAYKVPFGQIISGELLYSISEISEQINKEVAIYVDRRGAVRLVSVGTANIVEVPRLWLKRGETGFSGIRCIHTHPDGNSKLSKMDLSALADLRLDLIAAVGIGQRRELSLGYLVPQLGRLGAEYQLIEQVSFAKIVEVPFNLLIANLEKQVNMRGHLIQKNNEKALLVVVDWKDENIEAGEIAEELTDLARTAGLEVISTVIQKRSKKDAKYLIGQGKLKEITLIIQENDIDCVIFEDQLSPGQHANLMNHLGRKVLDRTNIILDIFAQRARSKEGQIEVELAQLSYLLPRLTGRGADFSRLGGGVGTRGPGETKLETDRRHIRKKIQNLKNELEDINKHRKILQSNRIDNSLPLAALVGYTNAGKSSLLNLLAGENVLVEDKLFATLDTTTRLVRLNDDVQKFLLTDTVGFIRNLPHQLVSAFKSTLDEVKSAKVLLHVVDISSKNIMENMKTVQMVLEELEVLSKPMIYVFNKVDLIDDEPIIPIGDYPHCYISAQTGFGLDNLKSIMKEHLFGNEVLLKMLIPYNRGNILDRAYKAGKVQAIEHKANGTEILLNIVSDKIPREFYHYKL